MRKIEQQMISAIQNRKNFTSANTTVTITDTDDAAKVYLHGHHIATYHYVLGRYIANRDTLQNWPTVTTKSRLRAMGVNVYTRNHVTYLNDEPV